jgi:ribose transport system permease protein
MTPNETAAAPAPGADAMTEETEVRHRLALRDYGILLAFLALFLGLALATDTFLTERNLTNILDQSAPLGIITCAITICIIAGIFDVSTGAMYGLSAVVAAKVANATSPTLGLLAGVCTGLGLGICNALVIHWTRINSFIGTLATSIVYRGLAIIVTAGGIVTVTDLSFSKVGTEEFLGAKWSVWVFVVFFAVTAFLLAYTAFGRYVYAVGGNDEAARLSGVRVPVIRGACYTLSGLAAGIAGVLAASRTSSAQPSLGAGLELTAIAAAVVGGVSIMGGEGAVWRGVLGVLTLAIIGNGFDLLGVDTTYQMLVQGVLILLAVAADQLLRGR